MKPNHRLTSLTLALLVVAVAGAPSFSRAESSQKISPLPAPGEKPEAKTGMSLHPKPHHRCEAFKSLNLTPEQKEKFRAANQTFREQNAAKIADLKAKHAKLRELGNDPAHMAEQQQLRAQLREDRDYLKTRHKAAVQGILTPQQESRLQAIKQECKTQWRKEHGPNKKGAEGFGRGSGMAAPEGEDKAPF